MENLPKEIIDLILEFQGYHKWRNCKYISQLYIQDKMYHEIQKRIIPKNDISTPVYSVQIKKIINDELYIYIISTSIYSNKVHWYMDKYIYDNVNIFKCTREPITKTFHYIFGHNEKQHLPRKI